MQMSLLQHLHVLDFFYLFLVLHPSSRRGMYVGYMIDTRCTKNEKWKNHRGASPHALANRRSSASSVRCGQTSGYDPPKQGVGTKGGSGIKQLGHEGPLIRLPCYPPVHPHRLPLPHVLFVYYHSYPGRPEEPQEAGSHRGSEIMRTLAGHRPSQASRLAAARRSLLQRNGT